MAFRWHMGNFLALRYRVTCRPLTGILVCLFSLLHVASVPTQDGPKAARKLETATLGLSAKHVLNLPIYLAQKHGIFESEGLDLKLITTKTDEVIVAAIKRAQQDAKITQSNFAPKDFVDWSLIRTVQRELKR